MCNIQYINTLLIDAYDSCGVGGDKSNYTLETYQWKYLKNKEWEKGIHICMQTDILPRLSNTKRSYYLMTALSFYLVKNSVENSQQSAHIVHFLGL